MDPYEYTGAGFGKYVQKILSTLGLEFEVRDEDDSMPRWVNWLWWISLSDSDYVRRLVQDESRLKAFRVWIGQCPENQFNVGIRKFVRSLFGEE